jgi:hypothetical protein
VFASAAILYAGAAIAVPVSAHHSTAAYPVNEFGNPSTRNARRMYATNA